MNGSRVREPPDRRFRRFPVIGRIHVFLSRPQTLFILLIAVGLTYGILSDSPFSGVRTDACLSYIDPTNPLITYTNFNPKMMTQRLRVLLIYTTCLNSAPWSLGRATIPAVGME
jgi:hypothetical protein